jgi:acyl-CoA synthetase (AMP-forming)/AMP-acid ligase II
MDEPLESLNHLMKSDRMAASTVALGRGRAHTWKDFQEHTAGLCGQLARQPKGRWMLSTQSSYAFGVGLFALWHTGRAAVLPPNQQPQSLTEASDGIAGLLTDSSGRRSGLPVISPLAASRRSLRWKELSLSRPCLELFTSGSTGERKAVTKSLAHLQSEIGVLEKIFGGQLGSCQVYSTVPHHHLYGLLFRLLWPLAAGRPFAEDTALMWGDFGSCLDQSAAVCLVSSPSHLERIPPSGKKALQTARPKLIFSSGGPLRESAVKLIQKKCGQAPVEVYGSTETGGIGWRQRMVPGRSEEWTPFHHVVVSVEDRQKKGRFRISSPFVSSPDGTFLMGDRGSIFKTGKFRLEGRLDRIVKIAEKRVSLDDMERRLAQHEWVGEAKIVLLESHQKALRATLGAAVTLNPDGRSHLRMTGRGALATAFRHYLRKSFDASTLPRSFRFIDMLPRNQQGKLSHAALLKLFQARFDPSVTAPQQLRRAVTGSSLRLRLRVPTELAYLDGHFPRHPIVPGIVQLRWVVEAAAQWLGSPVTVRRMEAIKFKNLLLPGRVFSMVVEKDFSSVDRLLRFSLTEKKTFYSSGRLVLG